MTLVNENLQAVINKAATRRIYSPATHLLIIFSKHQKSVKTIQKNNFSSESRLMKNITTGVFFGFTLISCFNQFYSVALFPTAVILSIFLFLSYAYAIDWCYIPPFISRPAFSFVMVIIRLTISLKSIMSMTFGRKKKQADPISHLQRNLPERATAIFY